MKKTSLPILLIMALIGSVSIGFGYSEKGDEALSLAPDGNLCRKIKIPPWQHLIQ